MNIPCLLSLTPGSQGRFQDSSEKNVQWLLPMFFCQSLPVYLWFHEYRGHNNGSSSCVCLEENTASLPWIHRYPFFCRVLLFSGIPINPILIFKSYCLFPVVHCGYLTVMEITGCISEIFFARLPEMSNPADLKALLPCSLSSGQIKNIWKYWPLFDAYWNKHLWYRKLSVLKHSKSPVVTVIQRCHWALSKCTNRGLACTEVPVAKK